MSKANENQIGTSQLLIVPTDDNILLRGTAQNSTLGMINTEYDKGEQFTYTVVGFGNKVTDLEIGDIVKTMPGAEGRITVPENDKSFERVAKYLKSLKNREFEEYIAVNPKTQFEEYFLIKRYAILAVINPDNSRNAIYND